LSFSSIKHINKIIYLLGFKMKIHQLFEAHDNQQLDELDLGKAGATVGSVAGKTANALGAVAGGVKGAWDAAKAGFQKGQGFVSGQRAGGTQSTAPSTSASTTQAPTQQTSTQSAVDPQDIQSQIAQKKQEISALQQQLASAKAPAQQEVPAGNSTGPAQAQTGTAPAQPAQVPPTQQAPAANAPAAPATAQQAPAANAPLTAQQQAAKKAELLGKRAAGKTTASQTGSGFNQYVQGGGGSTLAGADAQGNPVFKQNVKREDFEFESKFLGRMI
jgi:hypothetical protein